MSQPVLLNRLNEEVGIELHLFKNHPEEVDLIDFDYEHYSLDVPNVKIRGHTALWITQYKLRKHWRDHIKEHLSSDFDLVIGMNNVATAAVDAANAYDIPSLFFIRNLEVSGQEQYSPNRGHLANFKAGDFGAKVQYPFFVKNFNEYRRGMAESSRVIANSEYVSHRLNDDFDVDSTVVYPPVSLDDYGVKERDGEYIAMVNPRNRDKGGDIFLDIVESMPSEGFLSAGLYRDSVLEERANRLENLTHMGWCDDMRSFYKQAKVVIVPSRGNEAFGRAAAEPMISGIPCVVSDRGGLPEVVGTTGEIVSDIESVGAWQNAIERALDNHDPEAQMQRAEQFSAKRQGQELAQVIEAVT